MVIYVNPKLKILLWIVAFVALIGVSTLVYKSMDEDDLAKLGSFGSIKNLEDVSGKKIKAPDFTVTKADGSEVTLSSLLGKPVVINFWASWCGPCTGEMPGFQSVYNDRAGEVTFVMVNLTYGSRESLSSAKKFISDNGYSFPVYFDTKANAASAYSITSIPSSYFIDSNGYIVTRVVGSLSESNLRKAVSMIDEQ